MEEEGDRVEKGTKEEENILREKREQKFSCIDLKMNNAMVKSLFPW